MVMVTRSAHKKACESCDSSDLSVKRTVPPWCSSGKVHEKRNPRKIAPPTWEIRSSYPLRENIWEYLHENKSRRNYTKRKTRLCGKQTKSKENRSCKKAVILLFLFATLAMAVSFLMSRTNPEMELIEVISTFPRIKLISTNDPESSVTEECCYRLRYLEFALAQTGQALKRALRLRKTFMLTSQTMKTEVRGAGGAYIEGASATKGMGTTEWSGRVALWGAIPLWRTAPPPDTVLALRKPTPADCWPFSGSQGDINIELPRKLRVQSLSVEHIRPDTARSAPKHFTLYAILQNGTWIKTVNGEYKHNGPGKQYYPLVYKNIPLQHFIFRVYSNYGNPKYTCVYRVHLYENVIGNV